MFSRCLAWTTHRKPSNRQEMPMNRQFRARGPECTLRRVAIGRKPRNERRHWTPGQSPSEPRVDRLGRVTYLFEPRAEK